MLDLLVQFLSQYPIALKIIVVVGLLRLIVKPLMTIVKSVAAATPGTADDAAVAKVEQSKWYTSLVFALDYLASIKLPGA